MPAFKSKSFSPGNPITATDLTDLQNNILSVQETTNALQNTSTRADQTIAKIKNAIDSGIVEITNMSKDQINGKEFTFGANFNVTPAVVVSIAEPLKSKENIDLSVEAINRSTFKVSARANTDRKSLKVSYVAISMEEV